MTLPWPHHDCPIDASLLARCCTVCMSASRSKMLKPTKSGRHRTHKVSAVYNVRTYMPVSDSLFCPKPRCLRYRVAAHSHLIPEVYKYFVNRLMSEDSTESRVWVPSTSGSARFCSYTFKMRTRTYAGSIFCRLCNLDLRPRFGPSRTVT